MPLLWDLEFVKFSVHPLRQVFVSYSPWLSCVQAPLALKLHVLEAHLPGSGVPKVGLGPLTSWREVYYCDYTPACGLPIWGYGSWPHHALLPFLLWIFLCTFNCGFALMVAPWIVVVLVSVAGGEPGFPILPSGYLSKLYFLWDMSALGNYFSFFSSESFYLNAFSFTLGIKF